MKSDIEIARETKLKPISQIASALGIKEDDLEPYGKSIAKVPYTLIDEDKVKKSKLILVTAITPTKAGIGKTTVSVGLALGMAKIGKNPSKDLEFMYSDGQSLRDKIESVAKKIYGAASVSFSSAAMNKLAKTQYSFSQNPKAYGVPAGFNFDIKDVVINAGADGEIEGLS